MSRRWTVNKSVDLSDAEFSCYFRHRGENYIIRLEIKNICTLLNFKTETSTNINSLNQIKISHTPQKSSNKQRLTTKTRTFIRKRPFRRKHTHNTPKAKDCATFPITKRHHYVLNAKTEALYVTRLIYDAPLLPYNDHCSEIINIIV